MKKFNIKKLLGLVDPDEQEALKPEASAQAQPATNQRPAAETGLPSAPQKRQEILKFIIESLRPYVDEAPSDLIGLRLYVLCPTTEEEELFSVAFYQNKPDEFKARELTRELANNYIRLPKNWSFSAAIVHDSLPPCRFRQGNLGLDLIRTKQEVTGAVKATISILEGQATQEHYELDYSQKQTYQIGRGKRPVLPSGRTRTNDIAFLTPDDAEFDPERGAANASVSRNHAKISYDAVKRKFFLYAEEGGLPINDNKTKLLKMDDRIIRVDIQGMGYELANGDQIELGGEAKLLVELEYAH